MEREFKLQAGYNPAGDQPQAIKTLVGGIKSGVEHQTLFGATGTGKTFTVANVIEKAQKPTLVIAHNKTLAAQLAQEYQEYFPDNAVHYFVSYYDYYQPEAYVAVTDTYIEKETQINEEIERLRHASTQALLTRRDVIVVASVSCIYGLGSPEEYQKVNKRIEVGQEISRGKLLRQLVSIYFERTNADLTSGTFRSIGNTVEIMPVNERVLYRIEIGARNITSITKIDAITRSIIEKISSFFLFPAKHFVTPEDQKKRAMKSIRAELYERLKKLQNAGKALEAERLKRRTNYDLAMIREVGYCSGIENYSRHFDRRKTGKPPYTLLSYFPHNNKGEPDFLTVIDESHVTVPQIRGMYAGDRARKENLVEHGFRLPSAVDNRPLRFDEFEEKVGQILYTSATPGAYEIEKSCPNKEDIESMGREFSECGHVVEQIIRPTGLLDPEIDVRPVVENSGRSSDGSQSEAYKGQVKDFYKEVCEAVEKKERVIATTLTKRMAEDFADYLKEHGVDAEYLHSEIDTIERIEILTNFRKGEFDVLVGVNLLREGLDLPEVALIGILDADKEGFLRSDTSLLQIIGRAARNVNGRVILYADRVTGSMERAIDETSRRREIQLAHNKKNNITPQTIKKKIADITDQIRSEHEKAVGSILSIDEVAFEQNPKQFIREKEKAMNEAVKELDFETAALIRDEIKELKGRLKNNS